MRKSNLNHLRKSALFAVLGVAFAQPALSAGFWDGATSTIEARTFGFNREYVNVQPPVRTPNPPYNGSGEALVFQFVSGYTDTPVGVGLDLLGQAGIRLSDGRGTRLMANDNDPAKADAPRDFYGKINPTYKLKAWDTTVKYGAFFLNEPVAISDYTRLLQETFRGTMIESRDIPNLSLIASQMDKNEFANYTFYTPFQLARATNFSSTDLRFAGGTYSFLPDKSAALTYRYIVLEGVYQQNFVGLKDTWQFADGQALVSDFRYHKSRPDEGSNAPVHNESFDAMVTYKFGPAGIGVGYQRMGGHDAFPYLARSTAYLINFVTINDFANAHEESWQYRFDFDFSKLGAPGLTFMTRYTHGTDITSGTVVDGKEWERNTDVTYAFQKDTALNGFSVKIRNSTLRSNWEANSRINENRLILDYVYALK